MGVLERGVVLGLVGVCGVGLSRGWSLGCII